VYLSKNGKSLEQGIFHLSLKHSALAVGDRISSESDHLNCRSFDFSGRDNDLIGEQQNDVDLLLQGVHTYSGWNPFTNYLLEII
jgi:hypothetical protein